MIGPIVNIYKRSNQIVFEPLRKQLRRNPLRVGRNDPCPCGSGRKFKKCCIGKIGYR